MDEGIMYSNTRKEGGKKGWNDGERRREIWMGEYLVRWNKSGESERILKV